MPSSATREPMNYKLRANNFWMAITPNDGLTTLPPGVSLIFRTDEGYRALEFSFSSILNEDHEQASRRKPAP